MNAYTLQNSRATSKSKHFYLGDIEVADICLVYFVVTCVAFDDGSLVSQISRVAIVVGALFDLTRSKRVTWVNYYGWYIVFAVIVFLSRFWAFDATRASGIFSTIFYNLICFSCVLFLLVKDKRRVRLALVCMAVAPVILEIRVIAAGGVLAFFNARATDTISANSVGMYAAFGAFISYALYKDASPQKRIYLLLAAIDLAAALLSASRKAYMVMVLVLLLFVVLDPYQRETLDKAGKVAIGVMVVFVGVFTVMNVPFLYEFVGVRMEGMINGLFGTGGVVDSSTKTRMNLVEYGVGWFVQQPLFGFGGDNFRALMSAYHPHETAYYAHNNYIEMLVSYGLVGTLAYYALPVYLLVKGLRGRKSLPLPYLMLLCLIIGMLVMDYGMVEYYSRNSQMFIVLVWAAFAAIPKSASHVDSGGSIRKVGAQR